MNARDNIRPKSIRLAILTALASGAITTIDDLLSAVEETRAKVTNNAQAAYHDGLIKRMRDDVTGLAAYQITPAGKKYLAKYADGSKAEPVAEPVVRENQTTEVPTCQESRQVAQATKKAEAVAVKVLEEAMPGFTAEVIAQKDAEISSLSRRLRDAFEELDRANRLFAAACSDLGRINEHLGLDSEDGGADPIIDAISEIKASLELARMARKVEPVGYVVQRPAKPLVRFTKPDNAKARALSFARAGGRAQVFALVAVGVAVPGSEWKQA